MTANEPDAVTWQRLFALLVGDAAVDAATIREFCNIHGLTRTAYLAKCGRVASSFSHRNRPQPGPLLLRTEASVTLRTSSGSGRRSSPLSSNQVERIKEHIAIGPPVAQPVIVAGDYHAVE
jgi:hypothetical protein